MGYFLRFALRQPCSDFRRSHGLSQQVTFQAAGLEKSFSTISVRGSFSFQELEFDIETVQMIDVTSFISIYFHVYA